MRKYLKLGKREPFAFSKSSKISFRVRNIIRECSLSYVKGNRIFCVESTGSRSRAYARIWGLSRIWQETLDLSPAYILEVTHRFFNLAEKEQDKVLLHELAHIPKNFSGALLGHTRLSKRVEQMVKGRNAK